MLWINLNVWKKGCLFVWKPIKSRMGENRGWKKWCWCAAPRNISWDHYICSRCICWYHLGNLLCGSLNWFQGSLSQQAVCHFTVLRNEGHRECALALDPSYNRSLFHIFWEDWPQEKLFHMVPCQLHCFAENKGVNYMWQDHLWISETTSYFY